MKTLTSGLLCGSKRKKQSTHLQPFDVPISSVVIAATNSVAAQAEYCNLVLCFKGLTCALQIAERNFHGFGNGINNQIRGRERGGVH